MGVVPERMCQANDFLQALLRPRRKFAVGAMLVWRFVLYGRLVLEYCPRVCCLVQGFMLPPFDVLVLRINAGRYKCELRNLSVTCMCTLDSLQMSRVPGGLTIFQGFLYCGHVFFLFCLSFYIIELIWALLCTASTRK